MQWGKATSKSYLRSSRNSDRSDHFSHINTLRLGQNLGEDSLNINKLLGWTILSIMAAWIVTIALISVQNATPVSFKFLIWQSVPLPLGLLMAIGVAGGLLLGGILPGGKRRQR
jgi:uncharacterized integral membrane protein